MNIAVMSPHTQRNGNTLVASLISMELAERNRKVCLTHTRNKSASLFHYFHLSDKEDKTCNPVQILNLIREGGIRKNDISDYCKAVGENLEIFSLNSEAITEEQLNDVTKFICTSFPHDYVVFDIDNNDLKNPINRTLLEHTDCIVYVFTQDSIELSEFIKNKKDYLPWMGKIPSIVVVNRYCDIVGNMKHVALSIGIKKPKKWYTIKYNPWITYGTYNGKLPYVYNYIKQREHHLVDISSDLSSIVSGILSIKHVQKLSKYKNADKLEQMKEVTVKKDVPLAVNN